MVCRQVDTQRVVCNAVVVKDGRNREDVIVGTTPEGGLIELRGPTRESGLITLGYSDNAAALRFFDGHGRLRVSPIGGVVVPRQRPAEGEPAEQAPPDETPGEQPAAPEASQKDE